MVHELAHEWSDLWLNEGHGTWYQFLFAAENGQLEENIGIADFTELYRTIYSLGDTYRKFLGPVAQPPSGEPAQLFSQQPYYGGALVLYALRRQVGDATFQKMERAWVTRFRDESPSTADFIDLASQVSRQDLHAFLHAWLYDTKTQGRLARSGPGRARCRRTCRGALPGLRRSPRDETRSSATVRWCAGQCSSAMRIAPSAEIQASAA